VEFLIYEYLDMLKLTQKSFLNALEACMLKGYLCENFGFLIIQTHKFESKADDIRKKNRGVASSFLTQGEE